MSETYTQTGIYKDEDFNLLSSNIFSERGFIFDYWYDSEGNHYNEGELTSFESSKTLSAHWTNHLPKEGKWTATYGFATRTATWNESKSYWYDGGHEINLTVKIDQDNKRYKGEFYCFVPQQCLFTATGYSRNLESKSFVITADFVSITVTYIDP